MFAVPPHTTALSATPSSSHPALIALELAADVARWSHAVRYDADGPVTRPVSRSGGHDLWLISWLPGQRTDWHTHHGLAGAFTVVAGALTERVIRSSGTRTQHRIEPGRTRVFGPGYAHQLINDGGYPAVAIMCVLVESQGRRTPNRRPPPASGEPAAA
jgi:mannose-6-phosphate isomerase-like protein (cupin superfamily)